MNFIKKVLNIKPKYPFKDSELIYAATARCECGAGLAYPPNAEPEEDSVFKYWDYWDCSAILKGEAIPQDQEGAVKHIGKLPFTFYEIKSENQPSANGVTTRPFKN